MSTFTVIDPETTQTVNLSADNPTEQRVLDYLNENASEVLAEKINGGKKTLAGALRYAKGEAQKQAAGASCICIDDATVFGWIIHFFEEDSIKEPSKEPAARVPAGVKKAKPKKKAKAKAEALPKPTGPIFQELFSVDEMAGRK